MTLQQRQEAFIKLFNSLDTWQNKFQYLIDIGEELPELANRFKIQKNRIENCTSKTFFYPHSSEGIIKIEGWSNVALPSGMIAMLKEIFDNTRLEDMRNTPIYFQIDTGLSSNLTMQRRAALDEMIHRIIHL